MVAGAVGYAFSQRAVLACHGFRHADGDRGAVHSRQGRRLQPGQRPGGEPGAAESSTEVAGYGILFKSRPLVIFGLCVMLFHFANAPLLPPEARGGLPQGSDGDDVDLYHRRTGGHAADRSLGRIQGRYVGPKAALCRRVCHPARPSVLYTFSDNSFWLIGVQVLDGVGAGIFGALAPLVIADIMRGTGRYNLALGAIATVQGIGASLSGLAAGEIVDHFGYSAAFLTLGAGALVAVIVFFLQMPETAEPETTEQVTIAELLSSFLIDAFCRGQGGEAIQDFWYQFLDCFA